MLIISTMLRCYAISVAVSATCLIIQLKAVVNRVNRKNIYQLKLGYMEYMSVALTSLIPVFNIICILMYMFDDGMLYDRVK